MMVIQVDNYTNPVWYAKCKTKTKPTACIALLNHKYSKYCLGIFETLNYQQISIYKLARMGSS